jgi:5-methylcytosine-specific restriction endonuclease McrA
LTVFGPLILLKRGGMAGFYTGAKWMRKKARVLRRDKYLCQDCKRYGRKKPAALVHHIKPLEEYPELGLDENNLVSLCDACHNKRHPEKGKKNPRRSE